MIKYYNAENSVITELDTPQKGCWINLTEPNKKELLQAHLYTNVDFDAISAVTDEEEGSRVEIEDDYTMIVVDIPYTHEYHGKPAYTTIPLAIIFTPDNIITVCNEETALLSPFVDGRIKNFYTRMKTRFILQILYRNASMFLQFLRSIEKKSEILETRLRNSTKNNELIQIHELQKSLVYFTTSLKGNEIVLDRLLKMEAIKRYPEDEDLLEDTIIENKQAIEMAHIYSGILKSTMDAFDSIISNNLNNVMKLLAVLTMILSIPTMIFSAYGMNVNMDGMPFANSVWGFLILIGVAILFSIVIAIIFIKSKMFK